MSSFNYTKAARTFWRNLNRRVLRRNQRMEQRKEDEKTYRNIVPIANWIVGKMIEDTFLDSNTFDTGNRAAIRQKMAARTLPNPDELRAKGADPELYYKEISDSALEHVGVSLELVDAISYSGDVDGNVERHTKRFVKKR